MPCSWAKQHVEFIMLYVDLVCYVGFEQKLFVM